MESSQYTPDHPEYVPLGAALMGGYFIGFFESFCVFFVILAAGAVVSALGFSALSLIQAARIVLISYLISPLLLALAQRPFGGACTAPFSGRGTVCYIRILNSSTGVLNGRTGSNSRYR